ncbi:cysteine desulfurase family protein [Hartmannibacter diazotrophicus]|uniref:cysteine desulfurase family protein n=1 Tax=Hartmannibacter diazotrophicus TaxID=1482074 RepID=UPI000C14E490|nr:cysteine desulfurase family protein [Hartmannibacter diazotrophicus]
MAPAKRIYLDHNAGAPLLESARQAMIDALSASGNASSVHGEGRAARQRINAARRVLAGFVGASPKAVTFTSGGSEAAMTVLTPDWHMNGKPLTFDRLLVSAVEHPCVLKGGRFAADRVETIPVDGEGLVDLGWLAHRLGEIAAAGERPFVSVMLANNETGVLQPVSEIAALTHAAHGLMHSDAVQALGKIEIDLATLGADVITLSAHKIGGPQGAGAIVRATDMISFAPLITGGGQEGYARAGTENVAAISGFAAAVEHARAEMAGWPEIAALRDRLQGAMTDFAPSVRVLSANAPRLPNTLAIAAEGLDAETAVIAFDLAGIAVSSGSACSSGKVGPSHVLAAMGLDHDMARRGLRISLGLETTADEIDRFVAEWRKVAKGLAGAQTQQDLKGDSGESRAA